MYLTLADLNSLFDEFNTFFKTHFCLDSYPYSLMYRANEDTFHTLETEYNKQKTAAEPRPHFHAWLLMQDLSPYQVTHACSLRLETNVSKKPAHNEGYIYQRAELLENSKFFMVRFSKLSEIPIGNLQLFDTLCMTLLANQSSNTATPLQMENLAKLSGTNIPPHYYVSDKRMKALDCVDFSYILSAWLCKKICERNISNLFFTVVSSHEPDVGNHAFTLISIDPSAKENLFFFLDLLRQYGYEIEKHQNCLAKVKPTGDIEKVSPYTVAWDPLNPGGATHQPTLLRSFPMNRLPHYLFNWDTKSMVRGKNPIYSVDFGIQKNLMAYCLSLLRPSESINKVNLTRLQSRL